MPWHGHLALNYRRDGERCIVHDRHSGPLRILQSLYPESPGICHNVLVHPPGGIVGGDELVIEATLGEGAHALITTPGATRFYRSAGVLAAQRLTARVAAGARLEWLPLETICQRDALAENTLRFELAPGAETIGWDLLALGLPASDHDADFDAGRITQHIELPGVWLERGTVDGSDRRLLDSPLGWAGHRVMATMWFAAGSPLAAARRDAFLDAARELAEAQTLPAGSTSPQGQVIVLRVLAPRVEPAMKLLVDVWRRWREVAWALSASAPRVWRT